MVDCCKDSWHRSSGIPARRAGSGRGSTYTPTEMGSLLLVADLVWYDDIAWVVEAILDATIDAEATLVPVQPYAPNGKMLLLRLESSSASLSPARDPPAARPYKGSEMRMTPALAVLPCMR